jgi:sulfur carrier protein
VTDATTSSGGPKPAEIAIHVNAEPLTVRAASLADLLDALGYGGQKVATALNGDFVPERARAAATIANGDRVEILSARQGG